MLRTIASISLILMLLSPSVSPAQPYVTPVVLFDRQENGGPTVDGLQLLVNVERPIFTADKIIVLRLAIYNTLPTVFSFQEDGDGSDLFQVSITNADGSLVPLTRWGRTLHQPSATQPLSTFTKEIYGPRVAYYQIILNREFDLSKEGSYSVSVLRPYIYVSKSHIIRLESKTLHFRIIQADPNVAAPIPLTRQDPPYLSAGPIVDVN